MTLRDVLSVRQLSDDSFEAVPTGRGFLFGGLTLGVGLRAAARTVGPGRIPKSFHAYFLRPGLWGPPLSIDVVRTTDGRSFASRHVTVLQAGRTLAVMTVSFHRPAVGSDWQASTPVTGVGPADLPPTPVLMPVPDLIEVRPVQPPLSGPLTGSPHPYWARPTEALGEDPAVHGAAVAFMSDYMVIRAVLAAGTDIAAPNTIRTLDHGVWFHRPVNAEDWLLFSCDPVSIANGRGFIHGAVHSRDGRLIASFTQEVIIPS